MGSRFSLLALLVIASLFSSFVDGSEERVVGGVIAKPKVRRHLAYVFIATPFGVFTCTGTVLARKYVLSAAHCFPDIEFEPSIVRDSYLYVGLKTADPTTQKFYDFQAVYIHRGYDDGGALRNDVAIIELTEEIKENKYFPVILGREPKPDSIVIGAGYGVLNEAGKPAKFAMQTKLLSKSFNTCRSYEDSSFQSELRKKVHVCAVSLGFPDEGKTDTCYGDSGGPIFRKKRGKLIQYGITSFSTTGCAFPSGTPWYARVSTVRRAIYRVVRKGKSRKFVKYSL